MKIRVRRKVVSFSNVSLRRKRGMKVAGSQLFRRLRVQPSRVSALQKDFARRLSNPDYFDALLRIGTSFEVRLDFFEGVPVVVKNTKGMVGQGATSRTGKDIFQSNLLAYQLAVRKKVIKPVHYLLRSIKRYFSYNQFVVMEFVPAINDNGLRRLNQYGDFNTAIEEFESNFATLHDKGLVKEVGPNLYTPQSFDVMTSGKENGRWVIYPARDYV